MADEVLPQLGCDLGDAVGRRGLVVSRGKERLGGRGGSAVLLSEVFAGHGYDEGDATGHVQDDLLDDWLVGIEALGG